MTDVGYPTCPRCAEATQVRFTVQVIYGRYCYCGGCGNAWYHDELDQPDHPWGEARVGVVLTDRAGFLLSVNRHGSNLLKVTRAGLARQPRELAIFFDGPREWLIAARRAASGGPISPVVAVLRPREGRPQHVSVSMRLTDDGLLEWRIRPLGTETSYQQDGIQGSSCT